MPRQRAEPPLKLDGLDAARKFFSGHFAQQDWRLEMLWVAHLDQGAQCLHLSHHGGDGCNVGLPLRTIMLDAARYRSAAIVLAHNHPSGDPQPSELDFRATRRLADAAAALGCRIADHLVFAGAECTSFRSLGLL